MTGKHTWEMRVTFPRPIATAWYAGPASPHLAPATFAQPEAEGGRKSSEKNTEKKTTAVINNEFEYRAKSSGNSRVIQLPLHHRDTLSAPWLVAQTGAANDQDRTSQCLSYVG